MTFLRMRTSIACLAAMLIAGAAFGGHVPAGGNLQEAIDSAAPGESITLEPGAITQEISNCLLRVEQPM